MSFQLPVFFIFLNTVFNIYTVDMINIDRKNIHSLSKVFNRTKFYKKDLEMYLFFQLKKIIALLISISYYCVSNNQVKK